MRTSLEKDSSPPSIEVSPASTRSSVVLPAPLRPDRVMRSRRSRRNETPRMSGVPAMSLARSDAMTTATSSRIGGMTAFPADPGLEELYVYERGLTAVPADLPERLPRLRILDLGHNRLASVPASLGALRGLDVLYLHDN